MPSYLWMMLSPQSHLQGVKPQGHACLLSCFPVAMVGLDIETLVSGGGKRIGWRHLALQGQRALVREASSPMQACGSRQPFGSLGVTRFPTPDLAWAVPAFPPPTQWEADPLTDRLEGKVAWLGDRAQQALDQTFPQNMILEVRLRTMLGFQIEAPLGQELRVEMASLSLCFLVWEMGLAQDG